VDVALKELYLSVDENGSPKEKINYLSSKNKETHILSHYIIYRIFTVRL
jgi:hypothetical protein